VLVPVGQKAALLLDALATNPGEVRTKAELMDAAWPGLTVEESNLSVQIGSLRKLLGPSPDGGEWIATVPRVGYRFLREAETAPDSAEVRPLANLPALAVLPFQNMSGDPEQEYFADGIVEDIITALSRFRSFAVVARNSSFVYKGRAVDVRQVAQELGVRYVLEGSVRRAGQRLRITAQLIDGASGAHIWADRFDGSLEDVFDVQDRITESVIGVIEPEIQGAEIERSRRKRPENLDAYDLYLRALSGMFGADADGNAEAYALMERAIALEPDHGPYLAAAIWILTRRVAMGWPALTADDRATALEFVRHALTVAEGDAAVLAQCGYTLLSIGQDYRRGMQIVANAVEANPNNQVVLTSAAIAALHCGSLEDSLAHSRRVLVMSPRSPTAYLAMTAIAHAHMALGQFAEALRAAERSLAVNANYQPTYWMLIAANAQLGRMDEARDWLAKFRALVPGSTVARIKAGQPDKDPSRLAAILAGLQMAGLEEE
jgi:TolB-like protein/Tfp pilus assembly protein PilF